MDGHIADEFWEDSKDLMQATERSPFLCDWIVGSTFNPKFITLQIKNSIADVKHF